MDFNSDVWMLGVGGAAIVAVVYLAVAAVSMWIFYLIIRAAVKNGILRAAERGAFRGMHPGGPAGYPGAQPGGQSGGQYGGNPPNPGQNFPQQP